MVLSDAPCLGEAEQATSSWSNKKKGGGKTGGGGGKNMETSGGYGGYYQSNSGKIGGYHGYHDDLNVRCASGTLSEATEALKTGADGEVTGAIHQVPLHAGGHTAKTPPAIKNGWKWMKDYSTALKHGSIVPYSAVERKTRAATRNMGWGPRGTDLVELAQLSYSPDNVEVIFNVLSLRLLYSPEKWRNVFKALNVIDFLVQRGSEKAAAMARSNDVLERLKKVRDEFFHILKDGNDIGSSVRKKAGEIVELLEDEEALRCARNAGTAQSMRSAAQGFVACAESEEEPSPEPIEKGENDIQEHDGTGSIIRAPDAMASDGGDDVGVVDCAGAVEALKVLLSRKENALCADCRFNGSVNDSKWASMSLGVFICNRCAEIHQKNGLGDGLRLCDGGGWTLKDVQRIAEHGGNARAEAYWEGSILQNKSIERPYLATLGDLEDFIRSKYMEKKFLVEGDAPWPPGDVVDSEINKIMNNFMDATKSDEGKVALDSENEDTGVVPGDIPMGVDVGKSLDCQDEQNCTNLLLNMFHNEEKEGGNTVSSDDEAPELPLWEFPIPQKTASDESKIDDISASFDFETMKNSVSGAEVPLDQFSTTQTIVLENDPTFGWDTALENNKHHTEPQSNAALSANNSHTTPFVLEDLGMKMHSDQKVSMNFIQGNQSGKKPVKTHMIKEHEQKAHALLAKGLEKFDAHFNLISVSPTMSSAQVGNPMKPMRSTRDKKVNP